MKDDGKGKSGKIGAVLGAGAGAIGVTMANPLGRWLMFTAQDETGLRVHHFIEDLFKNRKAGDIAYRVFGFITNTIMAYPAILPIAGGLLAAGVGSIIGKKISKAKLKHQSLSPKSKISTK